jgi:ribosomal protein S18 acetylase RimI-like enzyme
VDEAWLVEEAVWAAVGPYRAAPGATVVDTGTVRWFGTGIDYEGLNGVLAARLPDRELEDAIQEALAPFRGTGRPMLWHVGPTSSPVGLPRALAAAGLSHYEDEPGMVAELGRLGPPPAAPAGLEVRQVGDEDDLAVWSRLWAGTPPDANVDGLVELRGTCGLGPDPATIHLIGWLDGTPLGCAAVFLGRRRDDPPPGALVENVVTVHPARRAGVGSALTYACLVLARARGLDRVVLTSSPDGHGLYRRLGFRDCCTVSRYRWPPAG